MFSRPTGVAAIALPAILALAIAAAAGQGRQAAATGYPRVLLTPATVLPGHGAAIAVSGIRAPSLQAQLVGATDESGRQLPWRTLVRRQGVWHGQLEPPALLGVYQVRLRTTGATPILIAHSTLRVLQPGTTARPAFGSPEDVARWWLRTERPGATLNALKTWPTPRFDRRDQRLHRLLVLAYSPAGRPSIRDRLGIFLTAYRERPTGHWRLLETTVLP